MVLLRSICFWDYIFKFLSLFRDSGSLNFLSMSSINAFSYFISFYLIDKKKYLNELSLISDFALNLLLDFSADLFLHEVVLLLYSLDLYLAFLVLLVETR